MSAGGWLAVIVVAVAMAASPDTDTSGTPDAPAVPVQVVEPVQELAPVVDEPYLEMAYTCDEHGRLTWVEPDTEQTRGQAVTKCGRLDRELDALPWPDGINP